MARKGTRSSKILVVTSCILYRSSERWHDSYLQGHFLFLWAHVPSWGQQSPDTLWLGMLKGAIWCWYCCPGHRWLASGMVCLFLGNKKNFFWVCWYRKPSLHCCVLAEFYSALLGRENTCCYLFVPHASPEQKSLNHDVWVTDLVAMLAADFCCFKGY